MDYTEGDGTVTFAQNNGNDPNFHMAFFVTDNPDGGSMFWFDEAPETVFGSVSGPALRYLSTGTDYAQFSGTFTPAVLGFTNYLVGVKEGGLGAGGAARVRIGTAAATDLVNPAIAFSNAAIDRPVTDGSSTSTTRNTAPRRSGG